MRNKERTTDPQNTSEVSEQRIEVVRAERTLVYEMGGMALSVEGKKDLVMLIVTVTGHKQNDLNAYVTDADNPENKYESATNLWVPDLKIQEDSFQLPPDITSFQLHINGTVSERFTVPDKIEKLVKAGAGLKK
jgi:hypothetical protein